MSGDGVQNDGSTRESGSDGAKGKGPLAAPAPERDDSVVVAATGAVSAVLALLSGVGLGGEQLGVILIGGPAKSWLIASLACAIAALGLGVATVLMRKDPVRGPRVAVAAVLVLLASLAAALVAASTAYSSGGRPNISKVDVSNVEGDPMRASVSFTVTAVGVRYDDLMQVAVGWVGDGSRDPSRGQFLATVRPDGTGVAEQQVTLTLDRRPQDQVLRIRVFYPREPVSNAKRSARPLASRLPTTNDEPAAGASASPNLPAPSPTGPHSPVLDVSACDRPQSNSKNAATTYACVEVVVPAAAAASPTP